MTGFARDVHERGRNVIGGGLAGYNIQQNNLVLGIETDLKWRHINSTYNEQFATFGDSLTLQSQQGWTGSLRGRVGWAQERWMLYATAGLAYGHTKDQLAQTVYQPPVFSGSRTSEDSAIKIGWTAGGGVDFALTSNWSIGVQYLYSDLGDTHRAFERQIIRTVVYAPSRADFDNASQEVTARLTYKFGN